MRALTYLLLCLLAVDQPMLLSRSLRKTPGAARFRARNPATYPTDAQFVFDHDTIPNFAKEANILSVKTGDWSDPTTWNLARVPEQDDIVGIKTTHTVTYDVDSLDIMTAIGVAGKLAWATDIDTTLGVLTLQVYEGGELEIGTAAQPIDATKTAEIIFGNSALQTGTADSPGLDPSQYGNGLLVFGKVRIHGAVKTPWLRTTVEPLAAATSFTFGSAVSGWRVGDELVIPDTRQLASGERFASYAPNWEVKTLASLASGNTVANLTGALADDHKGARNEDTSIAYLPHVGNLTRNVIFRSESGSGVRGHSLFTHRADVDIRWARFTEMGRTSNSNLKSTLLNSATINGATNATPIVISHASGRIFATGESVHISGVGGNTAANGTWTVTYVSDTMFSLNTSVGNGDYTSGGALSVIGTNQIGRYSVHLHHLLGPVGGQSNGYQWTLIGNVGDDPNPAPPSNTVPASKWGGLTVHGTSDGLCEDCVFHHTAGANLMIEDAASVRNTFNRNFSCNCLGDVTERSVDGRAGSGFFSTGYDNRFTNNVSAGNACTVQEIVSGSGFYWFVTPDETLVTIPDFAGADPAVDGTVVDARFVPMLQVEDNEAYGAMATGVTCWHLGTSGYSSSAMDPSVWLNFTLWHCYEEGIFGYPCNNLTIRGLIVRGDPANISQFNHGSGVTWGDYRAVDITLDACDIQGVSYGVVGNRQVDGTFTIQDTILNCGLVDIFLQTPATPGTAATLVDHQWVIDNVLCNQWGAEAGFLKIKMDYTLADPKANLRVKDLVSVIDFDQVLGDNFNLYYAEQAADFEMPVSAGSPTYLTACPEAGLTNAQAYVKYHDDGTLKSPTGSLSDPEGCAIGGKVAPAGTTTRAGIDGLIEEL